MRSLILVALVGLSGLAACDDTLDKDGARGPCASGGPLAGCEDAELTDEAVCFRMVECGYPLDAEDPNSPDWGRCMTELDRFDEGRATVIRQCLARSTCDELLVRGPHNLPLCFEFGDP